jgi:hypothetical protein
MKRIAVVAALLVGLLGACGEEPRLAELPTNNTLGTLPPDTTTTTAPAQLVPADSQTPAAGTCALAHDGYAVVELNPDIPAPRCTIVHSLDRLRFHNATEAVQTIDTGFAQHELQPDELFTLGEQVGDVWEKGVHRVQTSLYAGSGPEIWLK